MRNFQKITVPGESMSFTYNKKNQLKKFVDNNTKNNDNGRKKFTSK